MSDAIKILPGREYKLNVYDDYRLMTHKIIFTCEKTNLIKYFDSDSLRRDVSQSVFISELEVKGEFGILFIHNKDDAVDAKYRIIERIDISALGICEYFDLRCKTEKDRPSRCFISYYYSKKCFTTEQ